MDRVRIAILGAGYWGPNLIRTFLGLPDCSVAYVCDRRPGRLQYVAERFPGVPVTDDYEEVLADARVDAVAIATPVLTHRDVAERALRAGKHVFVEKPLARTAEEAASIVALAERAGRVLATGHVFVYHSAIVRLREAVQAGELGRLCYAASDRVNPGPPNAQVDVVWDMGVHDVTIALSLAGCEPDEVVAEGHRYVHPTLVDAAFVTLRFADGFVSQHHVSWLSPMKIRRMFVAGTEGSAVFDDMREDARLLLSDRGEDSRIDASDTDVRDLFYAPGQVRVPELSTTPPLTAECAHFLDCIRTGRTPHADGRAGLAAVRVLEAVERSIASGGRATGLTGPRLLGAMSAR